MEDYHMNRKRNVFIGLITCALLITTVFFVFNQGKSNEQVVKEYFGFLNDRNYKQMYQMLDQKTVYTPTQKYFVKKHKEIYDVIDAKNIQIKVLNEKDNIIKYQISMDTIAGKIKYKNKIGIKDEKIQFNKELIFDEFSDKNKIKVTTTQPFRGYILDRNGKYLAKQGNGYSVGLVRGKLNGENDYSKIAEYLETDIETIQNKMNASWINDDSFVPIKNISEQGAPEKWRRSEWKKATGAEVQNKELWKMYLEEAEKHETEFRFCASNDYQGLLREELT